MQIPVDLNQLREAHGLLVGEWRLTGQTGFLATIVALAGDAQVLREDGLGKKAQSVLDALRNAQWELMWTTEPLMDRLDWMQQLWVKSQLDDVRWGRYTAADIALFHISLRSVFDRVACVLAAASDCPGQMPRTSFRELAQWVSKQSSQRLERCGEHIRELVREAEPCFWLLRDVRDGIVHECETVVVLPQKPRILFHCPRGARSRLPTPLLVEEEWVDFELYGGMMYGYLLAYMEHVGAFLWNTLDVLKEVSEKRKTLAEVIYVYPRSEEEKRIDSVRGKATDMSAGTSRRWIEKAIEAFEQHSSTYSDAAHH